ncbi:MAG: TonB-dependent receptor [Syntrophales bacterium]
MKKRLHLFVSVVLLLLCSMPVCAEEPKEKWMDLDEVIVTGSRVETRISETPSTVNTITAKELEEVKYRNPAEVLIRVPGVNMNTYSGEDALSSIRVPTSFINPYTLILVDGIPASSYGQGNASTWRELNSMDIERIEVVKGPSSALYGSSAIGGVINVITKKPGGKPEFRLWGEYGGYDQGRGGVNGSFRSGAFAGRTDGYVIANEGWREHTAVRKQAVTVAGQFIPDERSAVDLRVDYTHFNNEQAGSLDVADFDADPRQDYYTFTYAKMEKITPALTYNRTIGDAGDLRLTFQSRFINDHDTFSAYGVRYDPRRRVFTGVPSKLDGVDHDVQAFYKHEFAPLRTRLIGGVDYQRSGQSVDNYSSTVTRDPASRKFVSFTTPVLSGAFDSAADVIAPYLQAEFSPLEKVRFTAGGRYDSVHYDVTSKFGTVTGGTRSFDNFTAKAGATYDVTAGFNLYASYSQGFVAPSPSQLFTTSRGANPDLNPEKAENYEVGMRSLFWGGKAAFDAACYDMRITDKIIHQSINLAQLLYRNVGETSHRGVEVQLSVKPVDLVRVSVAYTYARNLYENYTDSNAAPPINYNGNTIPRAPEHHLNARLALIPFPDLELELEADDISRQYADDANGLSYSRPTLFNLRSIFNWKSWSFWGHVLNLTDERYASHISESNVTANAMSLYPGMPLTFYAGVSYRWGGPQRNAPEREKEERMVR